MAGRPVGEDREWQQRIRPELTQQPGIHNGSSFQYAQEEEGNTESLTADWDKEQIEEGHF